MKVLLLNPPGPFCRAGSRWPHRRKTHRVGIDYHPFPFALAYATSRLLADGYEARVWDCIASDISAENLEREVARFNPDIVVLETSAPSFHADAALVKTLPCPTIAVGAHATATVREHLDAGFAGVIRGEYDQVISRAVHLGQEPYLATPDHPEATHAPLAQELDAIPYPAWDQLPMEKYNDPFCRGRSITVISSRGCPFECCFCTIAPYAGKRAYRRRKPAAVCDEIEILIQRYHPDEVYFDDDTITINRHHILALCEEIRRRNWGIPFSCMGNATVDTDILEAMAAAGCRAFKFGVETGDPEVMQKIPKSCDLNDVVRTVNDCRRLGIQTHATFLFGLPGETREAALRTIEFALQLNTHTLQFAIATPYPGTVFYEQAVAHGWLTKSSWMEFDPAGEAVVSYPGYTAQDIAAVHELAWQRWQRHMLLHRPKTLWHHFSNAWRREGLGGLWRLCRYGASRLVRILGSSS